MQGYQSQLQREKPKQQTINMSVEDMFKKIMENKAQLAIDMLNNRLATHNMEKQFE